MFRRNLNFKKLVINTITKRNYAKKPGCFEPPTMNELPIPCEPWDVWYAKKQREYRFVFAIGGLMFATAVGVLLGSGCLHLDVWFAPKQPAPNCLED